MYFNHKTSHLEEYTSPSVDTLFTENECIICTSQTGEKIGDLVIWDGENEWQ